MHRFQAHEGYTLVELMTIVVIVGVIAMIAVSSLRGYNRREGTRQAARSMAGVLQSARSQAIDTGRMTWVVFKEPVNGVAKFQDGRQFAAVIWDSDNDLQPTAADRVTPIYLPLGNARDHTKRYDPGTSPYGDEPLPDIDQSKDVPDGILKAAPEGTTFNVDATLGVPAVGFNSQGFPVRVNKPLEPSSGPGALYMTDDDSAVVSVVVMPIGEVRTLALDNATGTWK